jgi:hypothetical protein
MALEAWHNGHRNRVRNRIPHVRVDLAMLLCIIDLIYIACMLKREIEMKALAKQIYPKTIVYIIICKWLPFCNTYIL